MKRLLLSGIVAVFVGPLWAQPADADATERLLAELTKVFGPTGYEDEVRAIVRRELTPLANDVQTDGLGSLIARLDGATQGPRVMMAAHMDEVGAMVKYITPDGFVKLHTLGGWLDQGLINQRFLIRTSKGYVHGITGLKTPHVMGAEERKSVHDRGRLFMDVGATDIADAMDRLGIRPGDPIAPDSRFFRLNGDKLYVAKAWDDRVGLAVQIEVMRRLKRQPPPNSVFAVATVQEEIGLRGAHTSSAIVKPDIGLSIEVGVAADYPGISPDEAQERLGGGPGLFLHDSSMLPNLKLKALIEGVAQAEGIRLQYNVLSGYGEDGSEMQRAYGGAPAINITVPTRYLHNHTGVIHRDDFDQVVDLVTAVVMKLDQATVESLKRFD
jgi:endoglucanase